MKPVALGESCRCWAALAASIAAFTSCITPGLDESWVRVELPGLEIVSTRSAQDTLALAHDLALFREVVLEVTSIEGRPRVPTRIYLLDRATYRRVAPLHSAGFFSSGVRDDVMAVTELFPWRGPGDGFTVQEIIQHETVHFLTANEQAAHYPLWFVEGWAELLSTVHTNGEKVVIGMPPDIRILTLERDRPWLRLADVVTATRYPRRAYNFYAQSWALVHYLQLGRPTRSEFHRQLSDYVRALTSGAERDVAFERSFGVSLADLEEELSRYVLFDLFPKLEIPRNRFPETPNIAVASLGRAETADALGWLALRSDAFGLAERYFDAAIEFEPTLASSHAGRARAQMAQGNAEEAIAGARHALALAPASTDRRIDLAQLLTERAADESEEASPERRREWLGEARTLFREAIQARPDLPEPHLGLGKTYLVDGEPVREAREPLERAVTLLPVHSEPRMALARVYGEAGRIDDALALLTPIIATRADHPEGEEARELIDELTLDREESDDADPS